MSTREKVAGYLEVAIDPFTREVLLNLDHDRTGHIKFSPQQARNLARSLNEKADYIDAMPAPRRVKCSHCGRDFEAAQLRHGLIPTHDFPPPCRSVCRGAGEPPRSLKP